MELYKFLAKAARQGMLVHLFVKILILLSFVCRVLENWRSGILNCNFQK
jgi:hypothetical protein